MYTYVNLRCNAFHTALQTTKVKFILMKILTNELNHPYMYNFRLQYKVPVTYRGLSKCQVAPIASGVPFAVRSSLNIHFFFYFVFYLFFLYLWFSSTSLFCFRRFFICFYLQTKMKSMYEWFLNYV